MWQSHKTYHEHCRNEAKARWGAYFQRNGPIEKLQKPELLKPNPQDHMYGSGYFRIGAPNPLFAHSWGFSKCMGPGVRTYREGIDWRNLHRCHKEARPPSAPSGQPSQDLPERIYAKGRWWYASKEAHEENEQASSRPTSRSSSRRAQTATGGSRYAMKNLDNATRVGLFNAEEGNDFAAGQAEILDETFHTKQPNWDVMNNQRHVTMMQTRPFEQEECPAKTGLHQYLMKIKHDVNNQRCQTAPNRSKA